MRCRTAGNSLTRAASCFRWSEHWIDAGYITAATPKKIKVKVEDWDRFSSNDFLGKLSLPICAFYAGGLGVRDYWIPLAKSRKHMTSSVSGEICIRASITA